LNSIKFTGIYCKYPHNTYAVKVERIIIYDLFQIIEPMYS